MEQAGSSGSCFAGRGETGFTGSKLVVVDPASLVQVKLASLVGVDPASLVGVKLTLQVAVSLYSLEACWY